VNDVGGSHAIGQIVSLSTQAQLPSERPGGARKFVERTQWWTDKVNEEYCDGESADIIVQNAVRRCSLPEPTLVQSRSSHLFCDQSVARLTVPAVPEVRR
jgi:hypothetical protein